MSAARQPASLRSLLLVVAAIAAGTVAACETVDLGTPPADINACRPSQQFFVDEIWPNVLAKDYGGRHCYDSKCHDSGSGRPLTLVPPLPSDPTTVPLTQTWAANYRSATEQMSCSNVKSSDLITLPTGVRTHGGQKVFEPDGPEALAIEMWPTVQP